MNWIDNLERVVYIKINKDGITEICEEAEELNNDFKIFHITVVHMSRMIGFVVNAQTEEMADMISMYYTEH